MDIQKEYKLSEKPLENLVEGYSYTSIFRKMVFIGDSLSSGEFESRAEDGTPRYHDMFEYSWGQFIARKNGIEAKNFSRGGMTAREYLATFADENGFFDEKTAHAQAYVIALGVNDVINRKHPIGEVDDAARESFNENPDTVIGNYGKIICKYKQISPKAKFFLVGLPHVEPNWAPELTEEFNRKLKAISEKFENCYFIDLYQYGPVYDEEFKRNFYLLGHMNPQGYILTAKMIDSYIDYIIRHNPEDFKEIGFIEH